MSVLCNAVVTATSGVAVAYGMLIRAIDGHTPACDSSCRWEARVTSRGDWLACMACMMG